MSRRVLIPSIVIGIILIAGLIFFFLPKGPAVTLTSQDYRVAKKEDVVSRVMVSGVVDPLRSVVLSTHLSGPVEKLDVKVGDRVNAEQILAQIDVSAQQRELDTQRAQQATSDAAALSQVEQAQQQYQQYRTGLDEGLNQQIISAEAALRAADGQYVDSVASFDAKAKHRADGTDTAIREQGNAVENSRTQLISAALDAVRSGVTAADTLAGSQPGGTATTPTDNTGAAIGSVVTAVDSVNRLHGAAQNLDQNQRAYEVTLGNVDTDLATSQRAVGQAFEAKKEAAIALESARLGAQQQLDTHASAVDQAWRGAQAAKAASSQGSNQLLVDISNRDVRTPMGGIVTSVVAEKGKPAAGTLLTVADEGSLIIKTEVKEVDVPQVTVGAPVTFTTPTTGTKEFQGKVRFVSPVAAAPPAGAAEAVKDTANRKAAFPVEIEVTGQPEGLRIGGSAKAQIITEREAGKLAVPRDAIFEESGKKYVLVLAEDSGDYVVERREVTVGASNEIDTAITGGALKEGERVLNQPSTYLEHEGQKVAVNDATQ